jgi:predicted lipoprotein with Yx(FWY)xxD motif
MRVSIQHSVMGALAIGVTALVLSACGSSDNGGGGNGRAATASAGPGVVSIQSVDGTNVLTDSEGRTLYSAEVEKGRIRCVDACTSFWDPVRASAKQSKSASEGVDLNLGVVKRPDGADQLTFKGLPLYSFTQEGAGQLEGDGFVDDFEGTHFEWASAATGSGSGSSGSNSSGNNSMY